MQKKELRKLMSRGKAVLLGTVLSLCLFSATALADDKEMTPTTTEDVNWMDEDCDIHEYEDDAERWEL